MNNGGSVFTIFDVSGNNDKDSPFTSGIYPSPDVGLSVRDYFAAAALMGKLASGITCVNSYDYCELADFAFDMADAMLKRRRIYIKEEQ
jgi:hypothetical protein